MIVIVMYNNANQATSYHLFVFYAVYCAVCDCNIHCLCTRLTSDQVCRSGSCSANLLCQPTGGCNVDSDCTAGKWCNENSHNYTAKLGNGKAISTDTPHTN